MIGVGIGAIFLKHFCKTASTSLSHVAAFHILSQLRVMLLEKLSRMPLGYFNKHSSGEIKKIISEDVERIELFLAHNIPEFTGAFIYLLLICVVLFIIDFRLALAAFAAFPIGIAAQILTINRASKITKKWLLAEDQMNSAMVQYIQGMPVIKAFNHTAASFNQYASAINECVDLENRMGRLWLLPMSIFFVSLTANLMFIIPTGTVLLLNGLVDIETFIFFLIMGIGLGSPLAILIGLGKQIQCNTEGWNRIADLLNSKQFIADEARRIDEKNITVKSVDFGYDVRKKVIKGVDFSVPEGGYIALVGPSGAGKSTLARLLARFWDVDSGSICLGSTDIRRVNEEGLMRFFGLVFQKVHLFNGSIRDNIIMGRPDATDEQVEAVVEKARCREFIEELPDGIHTRVGEKGNRLSGGQKQRVSLARAILKDAPILILDEATAFIDPENEKLIQEAVNELVRGKTLIVIAHRLSTISTAEQILVLDHGRIVEHGSHQQLLDKKGLYSQMWDVHMSAGTWSLKLSSEGVQK